MGSLVTDIQIKLIDSEYSIMDILRIGLVIANKLKAKDIEKWIKNELHGYKKEDELPNYRLVPMSIKFYNMVHGWCPVDVRNKELSDILNGMALRQSISEIYEMAKDKESCLFHFGVPVEISENLSECAPFETEFHYVCNTIYFSKIIDIIKTTILEWVVELENNGIIDREMSFNLESIKKANRINKNVINNFYGDKGKIAIEQSIT